MDVILLALYYMIGCAVGVLFIAITNSVAIDGEICPYHLAAFSWGFVFWFLVMFVWLLFNDI